MVMRDASANNRTVIDKNAAHRLGSDTEELSTIGPVDVSLIDEADVDLVDQSSRLKCVVGPLVSRIAPRQSPKLLVNKRHQLVECVLMPLAPSSQLSHLISM